MEIFHDKQRAKRPWFGEEPETPNEGEVAATGVAFVFNPTLGMSVHIYMFIFPVTHKVRCIQDTMLYDAMFGHMEVPIRPTVNVNVILMYHMQYMLCHIIARWNGGAYNFVRS